MSDSKTPGPGTVRLHRVFAAAPEKIYRAILDPAANCKWLPPYGFTCTVHEMDVKVGGLYKMSFTNFTTGNSHSFGGKYLKLEPNIRIKMTDEFADPNMPGTMTTSYEFKEVSVGTEVSIAQEGIPELIPTEACYLGWQQSLDQLAKLVEPDIPDM